MPMATLSSVSGRWTLRAVRVQLRSQLRSHRAVRVQLRRQSSILYACPIFSCSQSAARASGRGRGRRHSVPVHVIRCESARRNFHIFPCNLLNDDESRVSNKWSTQLGLIVQHLSQPDWIVKGELVASPILHLSPYMTSVPPRPCLCGIALGEPPIEYQPYERVFHGWNWT